jgi:hypothetical protein
LPFRIHRVSRRFASAGGLRQPQALHQRPALPLPRFASAGGLRQPQALHQRPALPLPRFASARGSRQPEVRVSGGFASAEALPQPPVAFATGPAHSEVQKVGTRKERPAMRSVALDLAVRKIAYCEVRRVRF